MRPREQWIAFGTIVRKEIFRFMRVWAQTLLPPVVTMTLYFTIFGEFLGRQISPIQGVPYMQYIAPGLIMMGMVSNSYLNTVTSFYLAKFQKNVEEMLVSPMPNYILLLGHITGGVARGLVVGLLITIVALFFTNLPLQNFFVMLAMAVLTTTLFSLAGFVNAIYARSFDDISLIPTFVLTPLNYLGGVFYSIQLLPPLMKNISLFNPILYMVNAFRYGVIGMTDVNIYLAFALVASMVLILYFYCLRLLNKGVGIRS